MAIINSEALNAMDDVLAAKMAILSAKKLNFDLRVNGHLEVALEAIEDAQKRLKPAVESPHLAT